MAAITAEVIIKVGIKKALMDLRAFYKDVFIRYFFAFLTISVMSTDRFSSQILQC